MNWTVTFDPKGYSGELRNPIIIRTDDPDLPKAFSQVHGRIRTAGSSAAATGTDPEGDGTDETAAAAGGPAPDDTAVSVTMRYYFSPGCKSCIEFIREEIPRLENELGLEITLIQRNVLSPACSLPWRSLRCCRDDNSYQKFLQFFFRMFYTKNN